jgi:hypothetical protein
MIDNIIQYINTFFKKFDSLYLKLTDKEYPDIENYFKECFKLNILNHEIHYINKNILYNTQIIWTNQNPEINVYVVKYPINDYDSSLTIENNKRKTTDLIIFCEKVLRWIKFCIDNKIETEPLYIIKGSGVNKEDIFVTGSHLVFDNTQNNFIKVENYAKAVLTETHIDWFSCLITSDHKIKIGDEIFWDWEDHFIKK